MSLDTERCLINGLHEGPFTWYLWAEYTREQGRNWQIEQRRKKLKAKDFTSKALAAMARAGWQDGQDWPVGTKQLDGKDRGGWGNFSFCSWELPTGEIINWDSDDREFCYGGKAK